LDRYKYLKKALFEFISSISWGLSDGTKSEKVVLFGFSIGTKGKKFNFHSSNILNPKSTNFSLLVPALKNPRKKFKKVFLGICTGPNTLFLELKNVSKMFWQHLVPGTPFKKKIKKLR
jgi:hypothetical protein